MKKPKTEKQLVVSALRAAWLKSPKRREALQQAKCGNRTGWFVCQMCGEVREKVTVDHLDAVGILLDDLSNLTEYGKKMFFGKQRAIDKDCHQKKTKDDRKKMREEAKKCLMKKESTK